MLELLKLFFLGHSHKWVEHDRFNALGSNGNVDFVVIVLRCTECGKLKNHTVNGY